MSLDDIVSVQVRAETATPTREGFGTPLFAAYHTRYLDRVREYASLQGITDDGFTSTSPVYLAASKIFSQSPRPRTIKIGRRASAPSESLRFTPTSAVQGVVYTITFVGATDLSVTYTVPGSASIASVCTALTALIDALSGLGATDGTTHVDVTSDTPGVLFGVRGLNKELEVEDRTADPGLAADLTAIETADPDWYGLCLDSNSKAEILVAAAWLETRKKIGSFDSGDSGIAKSVVTTDVASGLMTGNYARSHLLAKKEVRGFAGAALLGERLPAAPGSDTWALKTLRSVPADRWTTTETSAIQNKRASFYSTVAGRDVVQGGRSGAGEWMDVTRFIDWLTARIKEDVFAALINAPKIPYTDEGVDRIRAVIYAVLEEGVRAGGLAASPAPTVTAPKVADVSAVDRGNRYLPDVRFTAQLAGAIHTLAITGTVSV